MHLISRLTLEDNLLRVRLVLDTQVLELKCNMSNFGQHYEQLPCLVNQLLLRTL